MATTPTKTTMARFAKHGVNTFGHQVRAQREAHGWTQQELSDRLAEHGFKLHQTGVARIEKGERPTSVEETFILAGVFGVPPVALLAPLAEGWAATTPAKLAGVESVVSELREELRAATARVDDLREQLEAAHDMAYATAKGLI